MRFRYHPRRLPDVVVGYAGRGAWVELPITEWDDNHRLLESFSFVDCRDFDGIFALLGGYRLCRSALVPPLEE